MQLESFKYLRASFISQPETLIFKFRFKKKLLLHVENY